ncbi:hypothetical protein AGMMS50268_12840 [Spirochaetia bacterium]|nr:hypothetical protein AGMMS50268_12840 [Spirochaetia bacterium]
MQCAIDSALGQDYDNIEVIVVNDGSTDNTDEIAKSYGDKIRYFAKENGGVSTALNVAIENAKGDYISWLSHDDYYLPNKISRQIVELEKMKNRNNLIPYSNYKNINLLDNSEKNTIISDYISTNLSKIDSLKVLYTCFLGGCTLLIPKTAFDTVGLFDEKLRTTQDYYLWFKFINVGYLFYYIDEILIVRRIHPEQDSIKRPFTWRFEVYRLFDFSDKLFSKDIRNSSEEDKEVFRIQYRKSLRRKIRGIAFLFHLIIKRILLK